jgi:sterol 3beta-glucosyltransferase/vancomycin aglycone glucosyltransferase
VRIALATVGTAGDVRPFAALASGLVARGHDVLVVSWELHRAAFAGSGAAFAAAGPVTSQADIADTAARAAAARSPTAQVAVLRDFHLREAVAHYRQLRELLAGHDLVVVHGIHSLAQAAAADAGVRWATAVFDPVLLPTRTAPPSGMPNLGPMNPLAWRFLDRVLRPLDAPLHAALSEAGSRARPSLFRGRSPLLHLVACSPSIIRVPSDLPATTRVTGWWQPGVTEALPAELDAFLADGPPPVIVTLGSMAGPAGKASTAEIVAGARQLDLRVVVQDAASGVEFASADGVIGHAGPVEHRLLFPRSAIAVHHGGAGTTHAAVAAGIPSVVIPHIGDQRYWAARLRALGVAPTPVALEQVTAAALADRLHTALTPQMHEVAAALGANVRRETGVENAVRLIERAAAHR